MKRRKKRTLVSVENVGAKCVALDPDTKNTVREFRPNTTIRFGSSIGGYYVRRRDTEDFGLELIRLSGKEMRLTLSAISSLVANRTAEKNNIIEPGRYLMATTSMAAHDGVFHRFSGS